MTQNVRTGEARGVTNLFGRLDLRQVRELADRTRDWPDESTVDLNNTDGGATLMVCRPESSSPTQGFETAPEGPPVAQPAVNNETRARLRHMLMRQVWDSIPDRSDVDTLAVANGILANAELLDAISNWHNARQTASPVVVDRLSVGQLYRHPSTDVNDIEIVRRLSSYGVAHAVFPPVPLPVVGRVWVARTELPDAWDVEILCTAEGLADRGFTLADITQEPTE